MLDIFSNLLFRLLDKGLLHVLPLLEQLAIQRVFEERSLELLKAVSKSGHTASWAAILWLLDD